ncbi:hypothetical protein [Providencia phage PSTRCR_120]|uniref:Uncharacterized protein n=1 Tax=Providencia phage PSTRCR_120 TaxID=2800826 RepID=A0A7T6ZM96_9CAUD|nr:hypothetical protein [Providencia phage PSTRCR_120]
MDKPKYLILPAQPSHRPVVASILHESDMHRHEDKELFIENFCEYCKAMDSDELVVIDTDTGEVVGGIMLTATRSIHRVGVGASIQMVSSIDSKITNGKILDDLINQCFTFGEVNWVVTYKHLPTGNVLEVYRTKNKEQN